MARKGKEIPLMVRSVARLDVIDETDRLDLLRKAKELYSEDVAADEHNIIPAREDMLMVAGDQWDPRDRALREKNRKPTLTVNRFPAFIGQYLGSWLQSDLTIKLSPTRGGTKAIADIRQGLIRATMRNTTAKRALYRAAETAYICGIGNFGVELVDAEDDVFARDIALRRYDDPFQVIWDRASTETTGKDAQHVFCFEFVTREEFKKRWPKASSAAGWFDDTWTVYATENSIIGANPMVRVCYFWQMVRVPVLLALERDTGDVIDITDVPKEEWILNVALDDQGVPITRETEKPFAECWVMSAAEVLEGPYRLPIDRVPVFRMEGWKLYENSTSHRWGFVRAAKDSQKIHNYWRSVMVEELRKSVSSKWLLDKATMQSGLADQFRTAHLSGDTVLFWDSQVDGAPPQQLPPMPLNEAVLTQANMTVQDMMDITNKHQAALGQTSNEVSARAINARQQVASLGDTIYMDNANAAMAEAGRVMNQLIPLCYDTNRVVKTLGEDDEITLQEINGEFGDKTPDITLGKYDVTYSTGPSYATKRQEAVDVLMTLMNTMPQVGNVTADIIVRNMDIPGADEIAARLAALMPPGIVDPDSLPEKARKSVMARMQQQAQAQAQQQQLGVMQLQAQMQKMAAEIAELSSRAAKQNAQAQVAQAAVGVEALNAMNKADANEVLALQAGRTFHVSAAQLGLDAATAVEQSRQAQQAHELRAQQAQQQAQQPNSPSASQGQPQPTAPEQGTPTPGATNGTQT